MILTGKSHDPPSGGGDHSRSDGSLASEGQHTAILLQNCPVEPAGNCIYRPVGFSFI